MNNDFAGYLVNDETIKHISNIMLKIGKKEKKVTDFDNKNKTFLLLQNYDPFNKFDFEKMGAYRSTKIENDYNFSYPNPDIIPNLINNLFTYLNAKKNKIHPLIYSIVFLYGLTFIHPFGANNDAISNTWFKLLLTNYNKYFSYLNLSKNIYKTKEFIITINESYKSNNIIYFINYVLKVIDTSIEDNQEIKYYSQEAIKLDRLILAMNDKPMTAYEIMEKLNIKSKETFRNSYINLAIEKGLVKLTNPNKPTSRNQMYYKISN